MLLSDKQLIQRFLDRRDDDAFEQLVRRHSDMVWGVCRSLLWQTQDVEDAYQVVFILLSSNAKKLLEYRSIGGWIHETAVRTCLNVRRQVCRSREVNVEHVPVNHEAEPWQKIALARDNEILHQAIVELPTRYREVVVLCLLEGKSRTEAASIIQCTKASVKAALARGRRLLRSKLLKQGVGVSVIWAFLGTPSVAHAGGAGLAAQSVSPVEPLIRATVDVCTAPVAEIPSSLLPFVQSLAHHRLVSAKWTSATQSFFVSATVVLGALLMSAGFIHMDRNEEPTLEIVVSPNDSGIVTPVQLETVRLNLSIQDDEEVPPEAPFLLEYRTRQEAALKNELNLIREQLGLEAKDVDDLWETVQADLNESVRQFNARWLAKPKRVFIYSNRLDPELRKAVWNLAKSMVSPDKLAKHQRVVIGAKELHRMYHASSQNEVAWFLSRLLSLSDDQREEVKRKLAEVWDPEWTELFQYQVGFADRNTSGLVGSLVGLREIFSPAQKGVFDDLTLYTAVSYSDVTDPEAPIWNLPEFKQYCQTVMDLKLDWMEDRYELSAEQRARLSIASKGVVAKTVSRWKESHEELHGQGAHLSNEQMQSYYKDHPLIFRCITDQCTSSDVWLMAVKRILEGQQLTKWKEAQEHSRQAYLDWNFDRMAFVVSSETSLTLEQHRNLKKLLNGVEVTAKYQSNLFFIDEVVSHLSDDQREAIRDLLSESQAKSVLPWFAG